MKILQNIFLFFYLFIFLRSALLYLLCSHFLFKNYSFPVVYSHSYYAVHCHINYAGTFKLSGWSDTVGRASLLSSVWSETAVGSPPRLSLFWSSLTFGYETYLEALLACNSPFHLRIARGNFITLSCTPSLLLLLWIIGFHRYLLFSANVISCGSMPLSLAPPPSLLFYDCACPFGS